MNQQKYLRSIAILTLLICFGIIGVFGLNPIDKYQRIKQFKQANKLLAQKKYTTAITAYDRLLAGNLAKPHLVWINRGYAFLGMNQYQDMLQSCSNATLIAPEFGMGWNCTGEALYYLEKYAEALEAFELATTKNPSQATFWLNKARVLSRLQQYEAAVTANQQAIKLITKSGLNSTNQQQYLAIAFNQKGYSLLKINQVREALEAFEQSLKHLPDSLSAQQGKGIALHELGKYKQAIAIFTQILQRNNLTTEQQAVSWLYTGVSYCQRQQLDAAKPAFKKVLQLTKNTQFKAIAKKGCGIS